MSHHRAFARSLGLTAGCLLCASPVPSHDRAPPGGAVLAEAVLAGGCFWGVEAVFEHVRGVHSVTSGFARYEDLQPAAKVSVPVEAVRIVYDPSRITYRQLLEVFFTVAHDPTSRDRQGPDEGPEYRAVVLYQAAPEGMAADAFKAELARSGRFVGPIVTEVRPLGAFTVADASHQDYGARHPTDAYVVRNDAPKLVRLQESYPALYQTRRTP